MMGQLLHTPPLNYQAWTWLSGGPALAYRAGGTPAPQNLAGQFAQEFALSVHVVFFARSPILYYSLGTVIAACCNLSAPIRQSISRCQLGKLSSHVFPVNSRPCLILSGTGGTPCGEDDHSMRGSAMASLLSGSGKTQRIVKRSECFAVIDLGQLSRAVGSGCDIAIDARKRPPGGEETVKETPGGIDILISTTPPTSRRGLAESRRSHFASVDTSVPCS